MSVYLLRGEELCDNRVSIAPIHDEPEWGNMNAQDWADWEERMKTLDMADKYDPLSYQDDEEITLKMQAPNLQGEEDFDLHGQRDTIPCPPPYPEPYEQKDPRMGLLIILAVCVPFWATVAYFLFR